MVVSAEKLELALKSWREDFGESGVLTDAESCRRYGLNTIGAKRNIPAILTPRNTEEVIALMNTASRFGVAIYPISTGNNWGYGSANPVIGDCVIVDLSKMTRIDDSDIDLGVVSVEPGVTQRMLRDFLDERGHPFLVPVHGGGPDCSLVGNALERGYGITPYADHFSALTSLEAVLPNGQVYHSALTDLGAPSVDRVFKWGIGPYLDGLFSQGSSGVVTRASIALASLPERIETFFFSVSRDEELEAAVAGIREVLRDIGGIAGSVNLMNARRVLSMAEPYPADKVGANGIVPASEIERMARRVRIMSWTGFGAMYGTTKVVKAARSAVRKRLKGVAKRLLFISPQFINRVRRFLERLPRRGGHRLWTYVNTLDKSLQLVAGAPSEIALPLAYWKSGTRPESGIGKQMNPAADGCGLIWYSPLVPMNPTCVRDYVDMVDRVCTEYGVEPLITLTSLSSGCFDSTVPLLFARDDLEQMRRARVCYEVLIREGQALGCIPYRAGIDSMSLFTGVDSAHWRLARQLKLAIDPQQIVSPGRYCPI